MNFEVHIGATRIVFLLFRVAVKFPRCFSARTFLQGMLANMQERCFWRGMKHPMLARVLFGDPLGLCVVMERAEATGELIEAIYGDVSTFFHDCRYAGLPVDPHVSNIGIFKNELKLIDYGGGS